MNFQVLSSRLSCQLLRYLAELHKKRRICSKTKTCTWSLKVIFVTQIICSMFHDSIFTIIQRYGHKKESKRYSMLQQKVSIIRKYQNHKLRTNPWHRVKELQDIYSNIKKTIKSRQPALPIYLVKMIAELERT